MDNGRLRMLRSATVHGRSNADGTARRRIYRAREKIVHFCDRGRSRSEVVPEKLRSFSGKFSGFNVIFPKISGYFFLENGRTASNQFGTSGDFHGYG